MLYTCLFAAAAATDLRTPLRTGLTGTEIIALIGDTWRNREDRYSELRACAQPTTPKIEMSYIGG